MGLTTESAFIRSYQSYEYKNRWLGFGRMKWNNDNNIKWTTKYRNTGEKSPDFYRTEIWAPDWNQVCDKDMPPDIFVRLYNFPKLQNIREGLVIAVPKSLYNKNEVLIELELTKIAREIPASTISTTTKGWYPVWKIRNQIGDINNQEIEAIVKG